MNSKFLAPRLGVLLFLALLIAGCGGGGGTPITQNVIRDMRAGDEWQYDAILYDGANNYYGIGLTLVSALSGLDFYGNTYRPVADTVTIQGASVSKILYISQDTTGTLRYHGEFHSPASEWLVTNPNVGYCVYYRSPMVVGDSYGAQFITYDTGATGTWVAEVVGKELINVPAGTFDCFKISANYASPVGSLLIITAWVSCDVGWVVKQINAGGGVTLTRVLSSKNRSAAKSPDGAPDPRIEELLRSLM